MAFWLMKSEPETFSIDDLRKCPNQTERWDGVRNYQARNFMRQMQIGEQIFFYHSNTKIPAIVGVAEVASLAYPDPTQFDPNSPYFDVKAQIDAPRWSLVDVRFVEKWSVAVSLTALKTLSTLTDFALLKKGNRLSVMPVSDENWHTIVQYAQALARQARA